MERRLEKIAQELQSFDEASLMQLWEKYHDIVKRFEPTRKWEAGVLVLGIIQAVHWKNQLFNLKWADSKKGRLHSHEPGPGGKTGLAGLSGLPGPKAKKSAKILHFTKTKHNPEQE
mgnify:CR=1 FL=1